MKRILVLMLTIYQRLLTPIMVSFFGHACRFHPTCSMYAKTAIETYGVIKGSKLALIRISKCHPFSNSFGYDPIQNS